MEKIERKLLRDFCGVVFTIVFFKKIYVFRLKEFSPLWHSTGPSRHTGCQPKRNRNRWRGGGHSMRLFPNENTHTFQRLPGSFRNHNVAAPSSSAKRGLWGILLWLGSWKREHFSLPGGGFTASKGFHFYLENCRLEGWCLAGTDFATNLVMHMFSHKTMHSEK